MVLLAESDLQDSDDEELENEVPDVRNPSSLGLSHIFNLLSLFIHQLIRMTELMLYQALYVKQLVDVVKGVRVSIDVHLIVREEQRPIRFGFVGFELLCRLLEEYHLLLLVADEFESEVGAAGVDGYQIVRLVLVSWFRRSYLL